MALISRCVALLESQVIGALNQVHLVLRTIERDLVIVREIEGFRKRVVHVEAPAETVPPCGSLLQADQQRVVPTLG